MSAVDVCKVCSEERDDHHEFESYVVPAGCTCDPRDWRDPDAVPRVCSTFVQDPDPAFGCATCEHGEACHATSAAGVSP